MVGVAIAAALAVAFYATFGRAESFYLPNRLYSDW